MRTIRRWVLFLVLFPYACFLMGATSNSLVQWANNGMFPVMLSLEKEAKAAPDVNGVVDDFHCVMTSKTHLNLLADVFDFKSEGIISIGDILISIHQDWDWYFYLAAVCVVMFKRPD